MNLQLENIFETLSKQCTRCRLCVESCEHLKKYQVMPGDVAQAFMEGKKEESFLSFIVECSLCGLCREICPYKIDFPQFVLSARQSFIDAGAIPPQIYRPYWVDHDWHLFRLFRESYELESYYQALVKKSCEFLFFPGCMLANASPLIVEDVVNWLTDRWKDVGVMVDCCGAPLRQIGLIRREKTYLDNLRKSIVKTGAKTIITACPTCHSLLKKIETDIEIVSIFQVMAESGITLPVLDCGPVTVHDSCSDRSGEIGRYVRKLLHKFDIKEMRHHGAKTICCGSGGLVSVIDNVICSQRAEKRMEEIKDCAAKLCITYCMSCTIRLFDGTGREVRHLLELLFDRKIDHLKFNEKCSTMWSGVKGEKIRQRIRRSKLRVFEN